MTGPVVFPAPPPHAVLKARLREQADALAAAGQEAAAVALRELVESWWREQEAWRARVCEALRVHHDINNALVGVRGNAQLLLMGPAGQAPGVKERLEVVLRETSRIKEAAGKLHELKAALDGPNGAPHAF